MPPDKDARKRGRTGQWYETTGEASSLEQARAKNWRKRRDGESRNGSVCRRRGAGE